MTDIVIPMVATADDNIELRFALRSFEKHLSGIGSLYIIGHRPPWLKNAVHIPFGETLLAAIKERNICQKVLMACARQDLSRQFLFANDDHFLLKDFSADQFPYYHSGPASKKLEKCNSFNPYRQTILNTINALDRDPLNYDCHCPILFHKVDFVNVMSAVYWQTDYGYLMKTLYCEVMKVPGTYCPDLKLTDLMEPDAIYEAISSRPWFSVGGRAMSRNMVELLKELYPQKSQWELSF